MARMATHRPPVSLVHLARKLAERQVPPHERGPDWDAQWWELDRQLDADGDPRLPDASDQSS